MTNQGDQVDMGVQGIGVVQVVFGPEYKRQASVLCGDGSVVDVECAMLRPLPSVVVGDHVRFDDEDGVVTRVERMDHGWDVWIATTTRSFVTSSHHAIVVHPNPLMRFASLIVDAETCAVDGAATEQAKCIAALATALRESETERERMKRTLRSIVEMAR